MDMLNLLNESYHDFIRQNHCHPTELLINISDLEALDSSVRDRLIGFNPDHSVVTFRGLKIISSSDVKEGSPFFVMTKFNP